MAILTSLKLINAKRNHNASPAMQRRNKLSKAIFEQMQLATAQAESRSYAPVKTKTIVNPQTGERASVEVAKKVKPWWWMENGKLNLAVRYGAKVLALGKGVNAVEVADTDQLVRTLEILLQAVEAGEMDAAIEAASAATRKQFK